MVMKLYIVEHMYIHTQITMYLIKTGPTLSYITKEVKHGICDMIYRNEWMCYLIITILELSTCEKETYIIHKMV